MQTLCGIFINAPSELLAGLYFVKQRPLGRSLLFVKFVERVNIGSS